MKQLLSTIALAAMAANAFCSELWFIQREATLTNVACFQEIHSTTNLPPGAFQIPCYEFRIDVAERSRQEMADPGQPWSTNRLIWAATDNTNCVVHYESRRTPTSAVTYCVFGITLPDGPRGHAWYDHSFQNYKDFITWWSVHHAREGF